MKATRLSLLKDKMTTQAKEYPHVTESEAQAIWLEAKSSEVKLWIKTHWFTGLRISEVLNLKAGDLKVYGGDYCLEVTRGKKRKVVPEELPIPQDLGMAIREYIQGSDLRPSDKLFPGHKNSYRYQLRQCAKRAGINHWEKIHPHMFRHGFVYHKLKGNKIEVVNRLVGHENIATTMLYFHPTQEDLREAMEK
ncbi:Tyrosine recombinase XerC [subsurface metagenome]